jgi:putative restriction endonuclease
MGMDSELIARISVAHRRRLAWFEEHQGEVSAFPGPLANGTPLLLVSKPKGIYKPGNLAYALSIRINLDSPYADGVPVPTPGGGWLLSYHQEGTDPAGRDRMFTNRGLMRCIADRIPVGVLRERAPAARRSQYDVLGLALPVRWSDGYFFFESLDPPAVPVIDPVSDVLEAIATAELDQETPPGGESLDDDYDARLRIYRQIVARRGQPGFRAGLLEAYQGRCAITGCDAPAALEAAHLRPYRGPESNTVTNGLLLRADIHTLLDLRLLAPDPITRVIVVSKLLAGTQYEALSTSQLADPAASWQRPAQEALNAIWQGFCDAEDDR